MPEANGDPTPDEMVSALGWSPSDGPEEMIDLGGDDVSDPGVPSLGDSADPGVVAQDPQVPPMDLNTTLDQQPPVDPLRQQLEQQNFQMQQQAVRNEINQQAQGYYNSLINQGYDQQQAYQQAQGQAQLKWQQYENQQMRGVADNEAKLRLTHELSAQYGVPREQLMSFNDPQSMTQAAKMYAETQGKLNSMQSQLNTQNRAPVQGFDSNNTNSGNSPTALKLRYARDPNFNPTPEQLAAMGLR